ncbi:MAG: hypothetical protein LBB53_06215 [Prevotellaceae bacterium]|jgi:hypothetical protein|nr:hypothetical protein [Prevotellaceae bacterium]
MKGVKLPEHAVKIGESITLKGSGFTRSSEVWLRPENTDKKTERISVNSKSIKFKIPATEEEVGVILKQGEQEHHLGNIRVRIESLADRELGNWYYGIGLLILGIVWLLGFNLVDSALLEGANWKQNTVLSILLLFCLLPSAVRNQKETWSIAGGIVVFFIMGGGNVYGVVALILKCVKIAILICILLQAFRLWQVWQFSRKILFLFPAIALICVILTFPIKDKNIFQSGWHVLTHWSWKSFYSDNGYHIYLGLIGIFSGITELYIVKGLNKHLKHKT